MRRSFVAFLTLIVLVVLAACTSPAGFQSPGTTGAPSTGTVLAQTARDQTAVPGTSTGGTSSSNIYNQFAAVVPPEVALEMLKVAQAGNWTAEQVTAAFKGLAGAPDTVTITTQTNTSNGGDAENLGAGGAGAAGAASGGSVQRP